ncbi:MAG: hypothetical protein ACOYMN_10370 [Roseimicrobium sp.]
MAYIRCPYCGYGVAEALFARSQTAPCSTCGSKVDAILLPALRKAPQAKPPELPQEPPQPGEAACFYNPSRRATACCEHCGVFVSNSWSAQWGSQTVCLKCLEELRAKNSDIRFEAKRTLWDNVALTFAIGPWILAVLLIATIILYPFGFMSILLTIATAPAAIFVAVRYWGAPRSLVPRGHGRLFWAILLSLLQIAGWVTGVIALIAQLQ